MTKTRFAQLTHAMLHGHLIRFSSRFESGTIHGYVLDVGPKFFLLALLGDGLRFEGFECFRIQDVGNIEPDPYTAFAETALKRRGMRRPKKPHVNVSSIENLLQSASREFPLVAIHLEQVDPDVCWIGRVERIADGRVVLLEIGADAVWDDRPEEYRLNKITRVSFGGEYEDALHLVGGHPPNRKS